MTFTLGKKHSDFSILVVLVVEINMFNCPNTFAHIIFQSNSFQFNIILLVITFQLTICLKKNLTPAYCLRF